MIYELRTYQAAPGRLNELLERFQDHTVAFFTKHGIKNIGYWTYAIGGPNDGRVYLVAFESMAQREQAWASFRADQDWVKVRVASDAVKGPLVLKVTNAILTATPFSPLK